VSRGEKEKEPPRPAPTVPSFPDEWASNPATKRPVCHVEGTEGDTLPDTVTVKAR